MKKKNVTVEELDEILSYEMSSIRLEIAILSRVVSRIDNIDEKLKDIIISMSDRNEKRAKSLVERFENN